MRTPESMEGGLMSHDDDSSVNLEQQRKRAKDLRRAHREGGADAAARIARHLPRARGRSAAEVLAAPFTLSEAQLVVAREAGFPSWPALKRSVDSSALDQAQNLEALLEAALAGDEARVRAALARDPAAARTSLHAAAALGDDGALALLEADPGAADRPGGARGWTPLLFLCCSRYGRRDQRIREARLRIARRLLALGADPNARGLEPGYTSGNVTMFDEHSWCPLEAAAGRAASAELIDVLLEAGANPKKTGTFLAQAVIGGEAAVLARALAAGPPDYQVIWALKASVVLDRPQLARLLVPHRGLPRSTGPALEQAILLERDAAFVELLLGEDTRPELQLPVRRAAYRLALRHGHRAAAEVLRRRGADEVELTAVDRLIAAAVTEDRAEVQRLMSGHDRRTLGREDHWMLCWAVRRGRLGAVALLLEAGLDPDAADKEGDRPLHLAVSAAALPVVELLLAAGAPVDALDFDGKTPLERALALPAGEARERLIRRLLEAGASPARLSQFAPGASPALDDELRQAGAVEREDPDRLFERAADAVSCGDLETLRELLDEEPALVHARSPRPHRATLLHYCGANGTEDPRQRTPPNAPAIAQLLLDRGADVNAECKMYGGGCTTMGLMLTSAFPVRAGLDGELARVLARAGAHDLRGYMNTAIPYGLSRAANALAETGVPVDDLFVAAGLGRTDVLEQLLAAGADVNQRFASDYTALMAAAGMGHDQAVKLLLDHGADPTLRESRWDDAAADKARHFKHPETARLIETYRREG
jgi:ankyrin repeat protein